MKVKSLVIGLLMLFGLVSLASASWLPQGWSVNTPQGFLSGYDMSASFPLLGQNGHVTYYTATAPGVLPVETFSYLNGTVTSEQIGWN